MNMRVMEGVELHRLRRIATGKGDVLHALKCTDAGYAGFGEVYFTEVHQGAVKGWKRHNRMTLNLVVVSGRVGFVIYDDREASATRGEFVEVELGCPDGYSRLTVAPGLWMAFYGKASGTSMVMDVTTEVHDDAEADRMELSDLKYDFAI